MRTTTLLPAVVLLLALAGCSSPAPSAGADPGADTDGGVVETSAASDADDAAGGGVCDLVPAAELTAAVGTDAGTGVAGNENGLDNCTWTVDGTPAVLAQAADAATYFPTDLYPKPDGATDLEGVDTGWASSEQRTVFIVKGGRGFMLNDFVFGTAPGDQGAWTALGNAIAANM